MYAAELEWNIGMCTYKQCVLAHVISYQLSYQNTLSRSCYFFFLFSHKCFKLHYELKIKKNTDAFLPFVFCYYLNHMMFIRYKQLDAHLCSYFTFHNIHLSWNKLHLMSFPSCDRNHQTAFKINIHTFRHLHRWRVKPLNFIVGYI